MFGDRNQDAQNTEHQEVKKCDINLDTVFQIADDVMLTSPNSCLVRVMTPEKPGPVLEPTSRTCNTKPCDGPASPMQANPLCAGPIIMAVAGNVRLDTYKQQEESVLSVPEQMPEDAIFEVSLYIVDFLEAFSFIFSKGKKLRKGWVSLQIDIFNHSVYFYIL